MNPATDRNRIAWSVVLYLAICFVATYALFMYVVVVPNSGWAIQIGFFFPTIAAIITLISLKLPWNEMGARLPAARWFLIAWLLPIGWTLVAYLPVWLTPSLGGIANTLRHSPNPWTIALTSAAMAVTLGALEGLPATAGEEFGWNGFLLPNLAKLFGPRHSIVLVGVIWTVCHYPLLLGPSRGFGPLWYQLLFFTVLSINTNMVYGYFRLKSGSTWPSVVSAAVNGVFIYMFADRITGATAVTPWLTGDFGVFMVVVTGVAAAWCWFAAERITVARATG